MKLETVAMVLITIGAVGTAGSAYADGGSYDEGDPPYLAIYEQSMIVLYEAMMGIAGTMVISESCTALEAKGSFPFFASVTSNGHGYIRFGKDLYDEIIVSVKPKDEEPGRAAIAYGRRFHVRQGDDVDNPSAGTESGKLYQAGYQVKNYNNVAGYPVLEPAFSANSSIFRTSAHVEMGKNGAYSVYDQHVIKDLYRLETVDGNCEEVPGGTGLPNCTPEEAFYDWGLEVISKYGYPLYKYRQDSEHIPWDGEVGAWIVRKSLATANRDNYTACNLKAWGVYDELGGDLVWQGNLTVHVSAF